MAPREATKSTHPKYEPTDATHAHNCNAKAHKPLQPTIRRDPTVMQTPTHALHTNNAARNSAHVRYESSRYCLLDKDARLTLRERNVPRHSTCPAHLLRWQSCTCHKPTSMKRVSPQPLIADRVWATTQQKRNEYGHETKLDTNNRRGYIGKDNNHDANDMFAWFPPTCGVIAARPSGATQEKLKSTYTRSHSAEICSLGRSKILCPVFLSSSDASPRTEVPPNKTRSVRDRTLILKTPVCRETVVVQQKNSSARVQANLTTGNRRAARNICVSSQEPCLPKHYQQTNKQNT